MQAPQHCVLAARLAWHGGKALQRRHGLRWCSSSLPSSEFRHNAATNDWVVFASGRSGRPYQFAESVSAPAHPAVVHEPHCPFCVGNETMTGPARLVADEHRHLFRPTADTDAEVVSEPTQWQLRVVDNKYPVVSKHTPPSVVASDTTRVINGHGWHEVVIERCVFRALAQPAGAHLTCCDAASPKHTCPISARPVDEIVLLLQAWVQRGRTLAEDPQVRLLCADHGAHRGAVTAGVGVHFPGAPRHHVQEQWAQGGGTCSSSNVNTACAGSLAIVCL